MPTTRQMKAFKHSLENGGVISRAMEKSGYSKAMSKNPQKLTTTKGWKELTEKYLSDTAIAKRHNEQLNSFKHSRLYFDIDDDQDLIEDVCKKLGVELLYVKVNKDSTGKTAHVRQPDLFFRDLAIDKAYKIKGRYQQEGTGAPNNVILINVSEAIAKKNGLPVDAKVIDQ